MLYRQGDYKGAVEAFRASLALDPKVAQTQESVGLALMELQNWEGAAAAFREALKLRPDWPEARVILSQTLLRSSDAAGAAGEAPETLRPAPHLSEGPHPHPAPPLQLPT